MKLNKNTIIISALCAFAAIFIILSVSISSINREKKNASVNVAFYDLSDSIQNKIKAELEKNTEHNCKFFTLDSSKELKNQLNKTYDLLITKEGINAYEAAKNISGKNKNNVSLDKSVLKGTTLSVQKAAVIKPDSTVSVLPLLLDNVEILLDTRYAKKSKLSKIESMVQLTSYAETQKSSVSMPIAFAGADSTAVLNLVTALTEVLDGKEAVQKAENLILEAKGSYDMKALCTSDDAPLYDAVHILSDWKKKGLLKSDCFKMTEKDIHNFMAARQCAVVFTSLSDHRTIEHPTLQNFVNIPALTNERMTFFPSRRQLIQRNNVCPVICAVPLSDKKSVKKTCEYLVSIKTQESLSRSTGLAPVLSQCKTPDSQADDVRFWAASSEAVLIPLTESAFRTSAERNKFAEELLICINNL